MTNVIVSSATIIPQILNCGQTETVENTAESLSGNGSPAGEDGPGLVLAEAAVAAFLDHESLPKNVGRRNQGREQQVPAPGV